MVPTQIIILLANITSEHEVQRWMQGGSPW